MWLGAAAGQAQARLDGFKSRALRTEAPAQRHVYASEWRALDWAVEADGASSMVLGDAEVPINSYGMLVSTR